MQINCWRYWLLTFESKEEAEEYKKLLLYLKRDKDFDQAHDDHLGIPKGKEPE